VKQFTAAAYISDYLNPMTPSLTISSNDSISLAMSVPSSIDVELISLADINTPLANTWQHLRDTRPDFQSPFWSLEFVRHSEKIGRPVEIAVIRSKGQVVGFFPFERKYPRIGQPVANKMNDAHGVLGCPLSKPQLLALLTACGLDSFLFHAWFGSDSGIASFSFATANSYAAALNKSSEFESYRQFLAHDRYTLKQQIRKTRKLVRDHGPLRFEYRSLCPQRFKELVSWKRQQYQRTNIFDIFSIPWAVQLIESLFNEQDQSGVFGVLSVLYAGDQPCAMHIGIQEGQRLHYWFPVYDPNFSQYSPGSELFLTIADYCQNEIDVQLIDLGYGEQPYKHKLINEVSTCYFGLLTNDKLSFNVAWLKYQSHQGFKKLPFKETVKYVLRMVMPSFGKQEFR